MDQDRIGDGSGAWNDAGARNHAGAGDGDALLALLHTLRSDAEMLLRTSQAARTASPASANPSAEGAPAAALPADEVGRHVNALLDALMAVVGGDSEDDVAALFTAADELAVDRATQGVSLEALLTGVGAARQIFLDLLVARARGEVDAGHLVDMLVRLDREAGRLQSRMILTHQATTASLARSTGAARLEALRSMVGSGDTTAAEQLGLDPGGRYHCIVADISTPSQARAAQTRLATAHGTSGLVLGYLTRVSTRLPAADRVGDLVAVHTPALPVEALPAAHALCRQTLELIRGGAGAGGGLTAVTDHALLLALDSASLLGRLLAQERLGTLSPQDSFHRQLAETGQTYLACGSRLAATAAALHVHPNTVAHRLRRLSELTSFPANERELPLAGATAWWWAFTTWLTGS